MMQRLIWIGIMLLGVCIPVRAQWEERTPGAPRTRDGKVNMTGLVGRVNGKPDLSGIWQVISEPFPPGALYGVGESPSNKYFRDILSDFPPGQEPLTPEGAELLRRNTRPGIVGPNLKCLPNPVPHDDLLPEPFKIIQTPGEMVFLYEVDTVYRQIYMDGRKLPVDPRGTWLGYSIGRWEGDTLVVDTTGFNDVSWLDVRGHGHSEDMRVEERFHRRDFGHLDVTVTVTDPKVFTKPVTINFVEGLLPDTDVFENFCVENEKDTEHWPGRTGK